METPVSLAWSQLDRERRRFAVAVLGVMFAVLLMLMQLGFKDSLYASTVLLHSRLNADLVIISTESSFLGTLQPFSRRRLYQARGTPGVASATSVYVDVTYPVGWRNPYTGVTRAIYVLAFDLEGEPPFDLPEVNASLARLNAPDVVLFDALSRKEYGPVAEDFARGKPVVTEVSERKTTVVGLFHLGTSFAVDGTLIASEANFFRLFPGRDREESDLGLVRLAPGADPESVARALRQKLPPDVLVLTRQGFIDKEIDYWAGSTPIGFVFTFGSIMGFVVGSVIVYQILFADVSDHLPEFATLKAMGFTDGYLRAVVLSESVILAALGYLPGLLASWQLYRLTARATRLPMFLDPSVALLVFALTVLMCTASGLMALRRLRAADPAEMF